MLNIVEFVTMEFLRRKTLVTIVAVFMMLSACEAAGQRRKLCCRLAADIAGLALASVAVDCRVSVAPRVAGLVVDVFGRRWRAWHVDARRRRGQERDARHQARLKRTCTKG